MNHFRFDLRFSVSEETILPNQISPPRPRTLTSSPSHQNTQGLSQLSGEDHQSQWEGRKMGCLCSLVQDREDTSSLTNSQIVQYHCDTDRVRAAQFQSMGALPLYHGWRRGYNTCHQKKEVFVHRGTNKNYLWNFQIPLFWQWWPTRYNTEVTLWKLHDRSIAVNLNNMFCTFSQGGNDNIGTRVHFLEVPLDVILLILLYGHFFQFSNQYSIFRCMRKVLIVMATAIKK